MHTTILGVVVDGIRIIIVAKDEVVDAGRVIMDVVEDATNEAAEEIDNPWWTLLSHTRKLCAHQRQM